MTKVNPYANAAKNRLNKSRADLDALEQKLALREKALEKREADLDWKIEVACEAIIAMVKDSKQGKVVPWTKFSQAAVTLERTDQFSLRIPKDVIELLKSERVLDVEERKDTPTKPSG